MLSEDFYGKKQFIWWTGIVEDRNDPLQIGSVRVRIIGLHSEDKNLVPTESLPWAQVMLPTTGAKTTSGPREGDWVFGFFQDGEYAQIPVVAGIFPGIESVQSQIVYNTASNKRGSAPRVPANQPFREVNQPTTVRLARGVIDKTGIQFTNEQLEHACDIPAELKAEIAIVKAKIIAEIMGVRAAIEAFFTAESQYPWVQNIRQFIETLRKYLKIIQKALTIINDVILAIAAFIRYIRDLIAWILSLPAKIAQLLKDCLRAFFSSIGQALTADLPGVDGDNSLVALASDVNALYNDTAQTVNLGIQTVTTGAAILEGAILYEGNAVNFEQGGFENFEVLADEITVSTEKLEELAGDSFDKETFTTV